MFLRKLFKIGDKAKWLTLELLVVFVGVYLAFLFQSYNEKAKVEKEQEKVFSSLKSELEFFRVRMPGRAGYTRGMWDKLKAIERNGEYTDFAGWRFLEPQYDYQVIEYAINLEGGEIIDFELFDKLRDLYSSIKRLEHAERLMMEMAQRYESVPETLSRSIPEVALKHAGNYENFGRLLLFMQDRGGDQLEVAEKAKACLQLINARMNAEARRSIEVELIKAQMGLFDNPEDAIKEAKMVFPDFSAEEIEELYREFSSNQ